MNNEHNPVDNELDTEIDSKLYLYHLYRKSEFMFLGGEIRSLQWATREEASEANDFAIPNGLIWVRVQD